MGNNLNSKELLNLFKSVFPNLRKEESMAILTDYPSSDNHDNNDWLERRKTAYEWYIQLNKEIEDLGYKKISLIGYYETGSNNADLPEKAFIINNKFNKKNLISEKEITIEDVYKTYTLFIALTEYSATAPLKINAKKYGFRATTMPGFNKKMISALKIDYNEVSKRVDKIKSLLDKAIGCNVIFRAHDREYETFFDLRFRTAHSSSGRFPNPSTAGNLPSGEAYIVPYEGEKKNIKSKTNGIIPVEINHEIVLYEIIENRAKKILSKGKESEKEQEHLEREPAYGNIAELGFGVLNDFGLKPINEILLDEKLGFHIAFGRSEHFGGIIGPNNFSKPSEVIHLDRIYIKEIQPEIEINELILKFENQEDLILIKNNIYNFIKFKSTIFTK